MEKLLVMLIGCTALVSLPTNPQVINGKAELISSSECLNVIVGEDQSFLSWQTFDIGPSEKVHFEQQKPSHCVLNEILSEHPSQIFGSLTSNGTVLLLNQHGVLFGSEARIDVGGLIATSLDLHSKIAHLGSIRTDGEVKFSAGYIESNGTIQAGKVEINGLSIETAITHTGAIEANEILFKALNGDALISGAIVGDRVELYGQRIGLNQNGLIDVSSKNGGGIVLFGADFQGSGIISPAKEVYVQSGAKILADAIEAGIGGKVILWSEEATQFYGNISATGWDEGGFVEVSSRGRLDYFGTADLHGRAKMGTLLLDPTQITIASIATSGVALGNCGFAANTYASTLAIGTLDSFALTTALASGNVIVTTSDGSCGGGGSGDIIVGGPAFGWAASTTLTLNAVRDININTTVTASGAGADISLNAGRGMQIFGAVRNTNAGAGASISLIADTGDILIGPAVGIPATVGTTVGPVLVRATVGNITITGGTGINTNSSIGPSLIGATSSGNITVEAGANLTLVGGDTAANTSAVIGRNTASYLPNCLGDITVAVGGNLLLRPGSTANGQHALIGHGTTNSGITVGAPGAPSTITVGVRGNVEMQSRAPFATFPFSRSIIGSDVGIVGTITANLRLNVGGDLMVYGVSTTTDATFCALGFNTIVGPSATSTQINVGGNIVIDGRRCDIFFGPTYNMGAAPPNPEFFVHCFGDIIFLGSLGTTMAPSGAITPNPLYDRVAAGSRGSFASQLWAGGSIICLNGSGSVGSIFQDTTAAGNPIPNCSVRAAGDVIQGRAQTFTIQGTGTASGVSFSGVWIEADACFAAGELWLAQSAFVNGVNVLSGTLVGGVSPAFVCNESGAVGFDSTLYDLTVLPTPYSGSPQIPLTAVGAPSAGFHLNTVGFSGNIVLHSSSEFSGNLFLPPFAAGTIANLDIGPSLTANRLAITGGSGNIEIAGSNGPTLSSCGCIDSYANITINPTGVNVPWTTAGSVYVSAINDLTVNTTVQVNGAASPITLIADLDDSGAGNLNLLNDITSMGGPILLQSGVQSLLNTSNINQTVGTVTSNGGSITVEASGNIFVSGDLISFDSGTGNQSFLSTHANVQIDEDVVATSGNVSVVTLEQDILLTTLTGSGGSIQTTTGSISLDSGRNIQIEGDPTSLFSNSGRIDTLAEDNTSVTSDVLTSGIIQMVTGNDMTLLGTANITSTGSAVTLVVDNDFPTAPLIGTGFISIPATAQVNSGPGSQLRIYTAMQPFNSILGPLNGASFNFGTLFQDSQFEVWCTYFDNGNQGTPFTVYYKNCLQQATEQGMIIVDELLVTLSGDNIWPYNDHGYNEFYGWPTKFFIIYDFPNRDYANMAPEPYFSGMRNVLLVHPVPDKYRKEPNRHRSEE